MTAHPLSFLDAGVTSMNAPVLHLFGGPYVTIGGCRKEVPEGSKRLVVFVALQRGRVERRCAAGSLWPVGNDIRASGNLRSALWRLRTAGIELIAADKWSLTLCKDVVVDIHVMSDWATRLILGKAANDDLVVVPWWADALDLLPGWYDDWALMERERIRQRMLHALEALSRRLAGAARCAEAVEAAMTAVSAEPLRESAQRALIEAHLAEGNWVEGRRSFEAYRNLLRRELGAEPPADLMPKRPASPEPLRVRSAPQRVWRLPSPADPVRHAANAVAT
jgi:DNA-binding SARP family transcriptional activator